MCRLQQDLTYLVSRSIFASLMWIISLCLGTCYCAFWPLTLAIEPQSVLFKENKCCQKFPKTEKNFKSIQVTLMERQLHSMFVIILHASNTLRMSTFRSTHLEGALGKRCSKNMQQIYKRTAMPKCDFNKVA